MKIPNNKLFSILIHFNKIEINRFNKYLHSPYFNKNQDLIQLFTILEGILFSKKKKKKDIDKEKIWLEIYGEQPYDDVRMRKLFSDLLKLVEGFISQEIYEENPIYKATFLIEAVGNKKLEKLYNSTMSTARRLSERQLHKPASFYYHQYEIERNYYELTDFDLNRSSVANLEEIVNNLDYFYLAEKLRYYCDILSRKNVFTQEYKFLFIDEIIKHIEKYNYEEIPPIAIYYQMYLTYVDSDNETHYFKLKELLEKYGESFHVSEAQGIYVAARNYCTRKVNSGNLNFLKELFDLNKELIRSGIIFSNGELSPWTFKNIVSAALRVDEYEWTEKFINQYADNIPEAFRENAVTFNLAQLYFYKRDYEKVIQTLQEVEYEDFTYNVNSKVYLLGAYYELEEIESLYSLIDSFRAYLNRNQKLVQEKKLLMLNLLKFTKKLAKIIPNETKEIEKLKKDLIETKEVLNKKWLLEKIAELE